MESTSDVASEEEPRLSSDNMLETLVSRLPEAASFRSVATEALWLPNELIPTTQLPQHTWGRQDQSDARQYDYSGSN